MFTGIITAGATLLSKKQRRGGAVFVFGFGQEGVCGITEGDSIAVSGVCLTAVDITAGGFSADVSPETLERTTLGLWEQGRKANIEFSLKASDRLGGHFVSGHVDDTTRLLSCHEDGASRRLVFCLPPGLARYVAKKGSVCIDGVSLTVNEVTTDSFSVCIIPHTLDITTLGELTPGTEANLEIDLIARYLERLQVPSETNKK